MRYCYTYYMYLQFTIYNQFINLLTAMYVTLTVYNNL